MLAGNVLLLQFLISSAFEEILLQLLLRHQTIHNCYLKEKDPVQRRIQKPIKYLNIHSTHFGIESIANIAVKIWNKIPNEIKEACFLSVFKGKIKKWVPEDCPCRLCNTYVGQVGFIQLTC